MTGQYVLVCPHRMLRPWSGQVEAPQHEQVPEFDASNPLCPGVVRANGQVSGATRIGFPFYQQVIFVKVAFAIRT